MTKRQEGNNIHRGRPWLIGPMAVVVAVAMTIAGIGGATAQPSGRCDGIGGLPANTQVQVSQKDGRAMVEIVRPGGTGRKVDIEYGDELYRNKFGPDGKLTVTFALTAANNEFTIDMTETAPITCNLSVPNFQKLYRVVLRWRDPIQLDLNVLEPGGRPGETGDVSGERRNTDLSQGIGAMDIVDGPPADGATAEMSYVVANAASIPPESTFGFKLDYVTRGAQPEAPYCDDQALAAPRFDFIIIANGEATTRKMTTNRAHCREKIADARRLMPIRQ
jgi:hypothetical protein